ncbi:aromatic prenyltransferase [Delitschia confertaspora ATCC 74209]|uniref:Aromatic prenyltransferase n=1 Tax=Delitschia confertaspora ATCC 74209 TaxID=1513339 RepID=A0A9P4JU07_9PLEO|nr:aromatic prenyltransferase [Delitschia confertaspora ATCC 74209]
MSCSLSLWCGSRWRRKPAKAAEQAPPSPKSLSSTKSPSSSRSPSSGGDTSILELATANLPPQNTHSQFWWTAAGRTLALMLHYAGYCPVAQYQHLLYFANSIAPFLGPARKDEKESVQWLSFMTDDGTPIELSWDWGNKRKSPAIRFSIEPVGLDAGTQLDLYNREVGGKFHCTLKETLPNADYEWCDHFIKRFCADEDLEKISAKRKTATQIFYAFDLNGNDIIPKVYFFPGIRAETLGQTTLESISEAVRSAPHCAPDNLEAFSVLEKFFTDSSAGPLELEMLAADLIRPVDSRLKIYFRSRNTRFSSVANIMSLNNAIASESFAKGLQNLRKLWDLVFDRKESDDEPLENTLHRTAGILYYAQFRLGDELPSIKIYLPVRHYAACDGKVVRGLKEFLVESRADDHVMNYEAFLESAFSRSALEEDRGVHTYLGCSINSDGSLKLISYINPQPWKLNTFQQ